MLHDAGSLVCGIDIDVGLEVVDVLCGSGIGVGKYGCDRVVSIVNAKDGACHGVEAYGGDVVGFCASELERAIDGSFGRVLDCLSVFFVSAVCGGALLVLDRCLRVQEGAGFGVVKSGFDGGAADIDGEYVGSRAHF